MAVSPAADRIEDLAQESKALIQGLADAINKLVDEGRLEAGEDLQPERFNELCTRAILCADEITRLARALGGDAGGTISPAQR